jgi:hypothetical protein
MSVALREKPVVKGNDAKRFIRKAKINNRNLMNRVKNRIKSLEREGIDERNVKYLHKAY